MLDLYLFETNLVKTIIPKYGAFDTVARIKRLPGVTGVTIGVDSIRHLDPSLADFREACRIAGLSRTASYFLFPRTCTLATWNDWIYLDDAIDGAIICEVHDKLDGHDLDCEAYGYLPWAVGENDYLPQWVIDSIVLKCANAESRARAVGNIGSTVSTKWSYAYEPLGKAAVASDLRWAGKSKTPGGAPLPANPNVYPARWPADKPKIFSLQTTATPQWVQTGSVYRQTWTFDTIPNDGRDYIAKVEDPDLMAVLDAA